MFLFLPFFIFKHGFQRPILGPHACKANTLPIETSPQPLTLSFIFIQDFMLLEVHRHTLYIACCCDREFKQRLHINFSLEESRWGCLSKATENIPQGAA